MTTANATQVEPPVALGPSRHRITVGECFRMGAAGILDPDARCELIEGEIIDGAPIGPSHASKSNRLTDLLAEAVRGRAIVSAQNPIVLGDLSAPQSDLALLRYRDDYCAEAQPGPADPGPPMAVAYGRSAEDAALSGQVVPAKQVETLAAT